MRCGCRVALLCYCSVGAAAAALVSLEILFKKSNIQFSMCPTSVEVESFLFLRDKYNIYLFISLFSLFSI